MTRGNIVPKLFHAACVVLEMRKDAKVWKSGLKFVKDIISNLLQKSTKSCTMGRRSDHEVPFAWGLHCRHCHRSTCFKCILDHLKMHSAEALQLFDEDDSREQYHKTHGLSGIRYRNSSDSLQHSQSEGTPVEGLLLLAHIALQYNFCMPLNPKGMEFGWYDSEFEQSVRFFIPLNFTCASSHMQNTGPSTPLSSPVHDARKHQQPKLTIKLPAINKLPQNAQSQSSKKRRQVYIEMPPAPYRIPHKVRRTAKDVPRSSIEDDQISAHPTPRVATRQASGVSSSNPTTSSEDIRRRENVANVKGPSTNHLLTRHKVPTRPVGPVIKPAVISPLKYKENQDSKRAALSKLSFKKNGPPPPREDSAAISTPVFGDPTPGNELGSPPSLTSPSGHDPQTPPSLDQHSYPSPELPPSGDEPIITQLLAQIAGQPPHVPGYGTEADSQLLPDVYWNPDDPYLPDHGIPKQPDGLYQHNDGETQSSHIWNHPH